jgi:hypothetical protein
MTDSQDSQHKKKTYSNEYYLKNKEKINERNRLWYHQNKKPLQEKIPFNRSEYIKQYRIKNADKPYYQYDADYQKAYREKKKLEKQNNINDGITIEQCEN